MHQSSPRSSKQDISGGYNQGMQSHASPTKGTVNVGVRPNTATGSVLSPRGIRRRASAGSNQGSRSGSPLTLQMEAVQAANSGYSNVGLPLYLGDSTSPAQSGSPSRSPYQSPAHSRSSSLTSVKSLLRDRSVSERSDRDHPMHQGSMVRDRSLDRQLDRHQNNSFENRYHTFSVRDRSYDRDRDYPYMGARSLERDYFQGQNPLTRSRSIDHEYFSPYMVSHLQDVRLNRGDSILLDYQNQVAEASSERALLKKELDATKEKLSSSMNSIKTFWSPELKKERVMRKEEVAKFNSLNEQFKALQAQYQKKSRVTQELEDELKSLRASSKSIPATNRNSDTLKRDKQAKEVMILRKTIEEMELRIETQKQTLTTRDESIKKLLEMLQSKGLAVRQLEEDRVEAERLRAKLLEESRRIVQLENILEQRDCEINCLKEDIVRCSEEAKDVQCQYEREKKEGNCRESLQAVIETKDNRIQALEREVKILEDELLRLREESATGVFSLRGERADRDATLQLEAMKSQEKLLKAKVENYKSDLDKKTSELCGVRAHHETVQRQAADHQHHILVLREQITAKEQQAAMLQADMDSLTKRLQEKDRCMEERSRSLATAQTEKRRVESELSEVQDHMDIKDRKVTVLQRKVENLEDLMVDKDAQLQSTKQRLASVQSDQSSSDSALSSLEETLGDRERMIERLKEQRETTEKEHQEALEQHQKDTKEFKVKLDQLHTEVEEKQNTVFELREELSELKSAKMKQDSLVKQLESDLAEKASELTTLQERIKKTEERHETETSEQASELEKLVGDLTSAVEHYKDQASKTQGEVDRLLEILKLMENEKNEKDKQIKDLQDHLKEHRQKIGTLKRNQQVEKKKNAQMLEEARKREDIVSDDAVQLKSVIKQKEDRVIELEAALKESVKITAQREMVMADQERRLEQTEKQMETMEEELVTQKKICTEKDSKVENLHTQLREKSGHLKTLQTEHRKQLLDVYEMKQEAILAAISEKDAHIGLLEISGKDNTEEVARMNREKGHLQTQLKELTQNRMKLMQSSENNHKNDSSMSKKLERAPPDQEEGGIWT